MTQNKKNNKEVMETKTTVPATYDYSQYAGQGFENMGGEDYAVPFLGVLQSNSPLLEVEASARAGQLVNTVTKQTYDGKKGIRFIPVHRDHEVLEWKPRNLGGGFVAKHAMDSEIVVKAAAEQEFGKWKTVKGDANSNDLIETFSVYGIHVTEDGSPEQMIVSFSSTKIKAYKRWMTKARTIQIPLPDGRRINPPLFAHVYRFTTVSEKNAKGSYFNFNIEFDEGSAEKCRLGTDDPLFQAAVTFFELLKEGSVKAAYESQASAVGDAEEAEIPFK